MISAVVIALNEAVNIKACIEALVQVTDDVILMDTGSTDGTVEIAQKAGAKVFHTSWLGYGPTKNKGVSYAQYDWILSIDADEVLTPELISEIKTHKLNDHTVYSINILTNYCGTWIKHSGWFPSYKKRLYHKKYVSWDDRKVHENLVLGEKTKVEQLESLIKHYSYRTAEDHERKAKLYAKQGAEELILKRSKPSIIKRSFGPVFRFFKMYVLKKGFLDGQAGFLLAYRESKMVRLRYQYYNKLLKDVK